MQVIEQKLRSWIRNLENRFDKICSYKNKIRYSAGPEWIFIENHIEYVYIDI